MSTNQKPDFDLPTERDLPNLQAWKEYLNALNGQEVRKLLFFLHTSRKIIFKPFFQNGLPPIEDFVNKVAKKEKLVSFSGYTNAYSKALLNPKEVYILPSDPKKKGEESKKEGVAIEAILFMYCKYGRINIDIETNSVNSESLTIPYKINPIPKETGLDSDKVQVVHYHFYYWKSGIKYESDERVGSYLLEIDYVLEKVNLINRSGIRYEGKLVKSPAIHKGWMVNILMSRKDSENKSINSQTFSIFFYQMEEQTSIDHFWVSYSKERILKNGGIGLGAAYVTKCTQIENWQKMEASPIIKYQLRKKRIDLPQPSSHENIEETNDLNFQLQKYVGIYEGYLIRLTAAEEGSSLNKFYLALQEDGSVILYTHQEHNYPKSVYAGNFKVIKKQGYSFLVIDYDFNEKKENDQPEFMHFRFILREGKIRHLESTMDCLLGTRIGAPYDGRSHAMASKVCLRKLNNDIQANISGTDQDKLSGFKEVLNVFFNPPQTRHKNQEEPFSFTIFYEYLDQLKTIPISGPTANGTQIVDFFNRHDYLKNFLFSKEYQSYTGRHSVNLIEETLPTNVEAGDFECYSFSLKQNLPILDYEDIKNTTFIKYPIRIEQNGKALIKVMDQVYQGKAVLNIGRKELMINFFHNEKNPGETSLMSCLFNIPESQDGSSGMPIQTPGVIVKTLKGERLSEGRVCILRKSKLSFESNNYDNSIYFDSFEFRRMDRELSGILSLLSGPINRIARSYSNLNTITPRLESNSFKKDLFYAACYLSTQEGSDKEIINRLYQAHIHGFAQNYFRGEALDTFKSDRFYKDLNNEREQLKKSIEEFGAFCNRPDVIKYINDMWFKNTKMDLIQKLLGLNQNQATYTITPIEHEGMPYPSDERAGKFVKELFDYCGLAEPIETHDNEISNIPETGYTISVGLLSNPFFKALNLHTEPRKIGVYFMLEENIEQGRTEIKIVKSLRGKQSGDDRDWEIFFTNDRPDTDYALLAKINNGTQKAFIIGGLHAIGTELLADHFVINWEDIMRLTDKKTNVSLLDSKNFVCLFSFSKHGFRDELVVASR